MSKSGFIAIIGRPNSGKSTLVNHICGTKVAIVSHVPQTTRNTIKGIYTKEKQQLVFLDTPGIHEAVKAYNKVLNIQAQQALGEADVVLYMIDLSRPFGREEDGIMEMLAKEKKPVVVVFNKVDIGDRYIVENSLSYNEFIKKVPHVKVHYVSALKGKGIQELIDDLLELVPEGPLFYPDDTYTDQTIKFQISEIIREKIIHNTYEEIPHAVRVDVEDILEERGDKLVEIEANIIVERDSQKGVIIGKGGKKLKLVGTLARKELEELLGKKVYLQLQVRVEKNWRNKY